MSTLLNNGDTNKYTKHDNNHCRDDQRDKQDNISCGHVLPVYERILNMEVSRRT